MLEILNIGGIFLIKRLSIPISFIIFTIEINCKDYDRLLRSKPLDGMGAW